MNWIDYREQLGIGFCDEQKFNLLKNKISVMLKYLSNVIAPADYRNYTFIDYFVMVCESTTHQNIIGVNESMDNATSMADLISKYVAFSNTAHKHLNNTTTISIIRNFLLNELDYLHIQYTLFEDEEGFFIYPKGAKELDDALVSEPLEWLKDYPNARKTYITALKQYSEGIYIRDVADNLRKALETFLQEFLGNTKNLENNRIEICKYLGNQGVDAGITGLFQPLINSYKNINDRIAKHNDAVDARLLEFLLYQTGVLIRMVISIKNLKIPNPNNEHIGLIVQ